MTLLVRDEEDILQANIDFHLSQGVDFIIATDNLSVDSTKNILKEYESKGKLHYIYEGEDNYNQHMWVTKMAQMAAKELDADWVINNDADEFWWPKSGNLKETFAAIKSEYNILEAERNNLVPMIDKTAAQPFYQVMTYQEVESLSPVGKPLPSKRAHIADPNVIVKQGNHLVEGIGEQKIITDLIDIFHFPIRSYTQIEKNIISMGAAYERNTELPESVGDARRALYYEYKKRGNVHNYYDQRAFDEARITRELKAGNVIENTCLKDYLSGLYNCRLLEQNAENSYL